MPITEQIIDTDTADGPMAIVHAASEAGSTKRVLIFMDAPGIRGSLHAFAARLAEAGYEVAIPDLWHRHGRMIGFDPVDDAEANQANRMKIMEMLATLDDAQVRMDRDAALDALGWTDGPMGTIGFCLGARYVHKAMQELPDRFPVGAMWHPSFLTDDTDASPHLTVDQIGELWIGIGTADQVQSIEMHRRYFDAIEGMDDITLRIFDGAYDDIGDGGYSAADNPLQAMPSAQCLAVAEEAVRRWHDPAAGLKIYIGPSNSERCSDTLLADGHALAARYDTGFHAHLLETKVQRTARLAASGETPVARLERLGALSERASFAHCVWCDATDVALF
ncbi:MAG: dienelactone hydrolase family protein, partial [Actinomycetota bacterium]